MDKNTATGFALIFVLMLAWFYFTMPSEEELAQQQRERAIQDSLAWVEQNRQGTLPQPQTEEQNTTPALTENGSAETALPQGLFAEASNQEESKIMVETPLYRVEFTNKGAGPSSFLLNQYNTWDGYRVQLISDTSRSVYNIGFLSTENYYVETQAFNFTPLTTESEIVLGENDTREIAYELALEDGRRLQIIYQLSGDSYGIKADVRFVGLRDYVIGHAIDFGWTTPLNFTERDQSQDALETAAYVYSGGELEKFKVDKPGRQEQAINGAINWVATKTKFFTQIIKPVSPTDAAQIAGEVSGLDDSPNTEHRYVTSVQTDLDQEGTASFRLFIGPMQYRDLQTFDEHAYDMVDVGWKWLRWFSDPFVRWMVIPFFEFMNRFTSSFGLIIIVFATLVKLVLSPLTYKSYKSMAAMGKLQPLMKEIQEKYKDNPQKQQKATMDLYRKHKVNPLGGCLPNLLQFPILITLWRYFQNSILIRQEEFLWASDLSAPDYIISLPFSIPFLGSQIAGFVLLMTAAMIVQSRLTGGMSGGGASSPMAGQMKVMQYIFPLMLLFIFNNFASGLSLYYLIFNVLSIIQQFFIKRGMNEDAPQAAAAK